MKPLSFISLRALARAALVGAVALACVAALAPAPASASRYARFGVQDDAWLAFGPGGTLDDRLDLLETLGVDIVRYTLRWDRIAAKRPASPRSASDPAYDWGVADPLLTGLHQRGITAVVTITGSPRWANGGRSPNWVPSSKWSLAAFARAAATRYPFVRRWTIWNEPNQRSQLRPTSASVYVKTLLNPAYAAIKQANRRAVVAGGVTAPRGGIGGVSPLDWISGMGAANARLDAYAHNPYPLRPQVETPFRGGCGHCETATMATLDRLIGAVRRHLGPKRIWLTEYGYQTNPPDRWLGVSPALQARYLGEAAFRTWTAPYVDMLIHFMLRDDVVNSRFETGHWQSGLMTAGLVRKPSFYAYMLPLAQASRTGLRTAVWGQVRPRSGAQPYVLQRYAGGRWVSVGTRRITGRGGMFLRTIRAGAGARLRLWSPRDGRSSPILVIR
jgi:hypothetical protein